MSVPGVSYSLSGKMRQLTRMMAKTARAARSFMPALNIIDLGLGEVRFETETPNESFSQSSEPLFKFVY